MSHHNVPEGFDKWTKVLTGALMNRGDCKTLAEVMELRNQGWGCNELDTVFQGGMNVVNTDRSPEHDVKWLPRMRESLCEMDTEMDFIKRVKRFIDISCGSGGYSTYIMQKCPLSTGVGISYPVEEGGHVLEIAPNLLKRIEIHSERPTNFDLAPEMAKPESPFPPFKPLPFKYQSFDMVVCSAQPLRLSPDTANRPWNWERILVSRLLMSLRAVSPGGTIFFRLSHPEGAVEARILLALGRVAGLVRTIKPKFVHSIRTSFYVIAQKVSTDTEEYRALVHSLEKLWYVMSFEGENGYGRAVNWEEEEGITPWSDVMSEDGIDTIARLGKPVWSTQSSALRKFLHAKGVRIRRPE